MRCRSLKVSDSRAAFCQLSYFHRGIHGAEKEGAITNPGIPTSYFKVEHQYHITAVLMYYTSIILHGEYCHKDVEEVSSTGVTSVDR